MGEVRRWLISLTSIIVNNAYRAYYARHGSSTEDLSRPDTSASVATEYHFMSLTRPRNRPHQVYTNNTYHPNRDSLIITRAGDDNILTEIRGEPRRKVSQVWSPHLWHDRRTMGKRRSMFQAPSIEEQAECSALSRRKVQIVLFAVGFIFPFGTLGPRPFYLVNSFYCIKGGSEN